MFIPQEFIRKKRDREPLSDEEIISFVAGITSGSVTEAQIAAFAMAVFLNDLSDHETAALTLAMRDSGDVMNWDLPGPVIDKHSTGGVGDMVSLMLGPLVAACGGYVPMITGRGLGHTGGTLDKLESIPGFNAAPDNQLFRQCVRDLGVCIIGQTEKLAPADKRFYATRDITATVESIRLITASILSKKLAEGLDFLVMDVKCGNGAFMSDPGRAATLAESIVKVADAAGVRTRALITDMNSPLAYSAGNALEITEAVAFLRNDKLHPGLKEVTLKLAAEMLLLSGLADCPEDAERKVLAVLESGAALEIFAEMVHRLGGPADFCEKPSFYMPEAPVCRPVCVSSECCVQTWDTRAAGMTVVALGGGRLRSQDPVDHRVGLSQIAVPGQTLLPGDALAWISAASEEDWLRAEKQLRAAVVTGVPGRSDYGSRITGVIG